MSAPTPHWQPGEGQPATWPAPPPPTPPNAMAALVLGVLGLVALGPLGSIPAIVLGRSAQREIRDSGGRLGGEGVATAGYVMGIVGTVLFVLVLGFALLVFAIVGISFLGLFAAVGTAGA